MPACKRHDQSVLALRICADRVDDAEHEVDGFFDLLETLALRCCYADREVAHAFRQLIANDAQCRLAVGDHQNPPTGRKHVAYDIRDRVRLARAGRPLNDEAIGLFKATNDFDLIVVERLGKEKIALVRVDWLVMLKRVGICARVDRVAERLVGIVNAVGRTHDKRARGTFQDGLRRFAGRKLFLESLDVAENRIG